MDLAATVSGKVAIVTGASSGLGAHFAALLARSGAKVVAAARRVERLAQLEAEMSGAGATLASEPLDVTSPATIEACVAATLKRFGRLDILINNAGAADSRPAMEVPESEWDAVVDVNLKGAFQMAQAAGRAMREGGGGSIVNIASILGLRVSPGVLPYAVSKAGVVQMTKALALEWARYKIRVNAIAPGYFQTEINAGYFETEGGQAMLKRIAMRRIGEARELDGVLLLLSGDASSYMTGAIVPVDGGHLVSSL